MQRFSPLIKKFFESQSPVLRDTLEVLTQTFRPGAAQTVGLSFNGGKDSTVILFLALYLLQQSAY